MQYTLSSGSFSRFVGYQAQYEQKELIIFQPALLPRIRCLPKAFQGGKWGRWISFLGMFGVGSYAAIFGADAGSLVGLLWICLGILQSVGGHTRPLKIVQSGVILAY